MKIKPSRKARGLDNTGSRQQAGRSTDKASSRLLVLVLMQCEAGSCGRVAVVSGHSVWLGWAGLGWAAGSDKIQVLEQAAVEPWLASAR